MRKLISIAVLLMTFGYANANTFCYGPISQVSVTPDGHVTVNAQALASSHVYLCSVVSDANGVTPLPARQSYPFSSPRRLPDPMWSGRLQIRLHADREPLGSNSRTGIGGQIRCEAVLHINEATCSLEAVSGHQRPRTATLRTH